MAGRSMAVLPVSISLFVSWLSGTGRGGAGWGGVGRARGALGKGEAGRTGWGGAGYREPPRRPLTSSRPQRVLLHVATC